MDVKLEAAETVIGQQEAPVLKPGIASMEDCRDSGLPWLTKARIPAASFGQFLAISSVVYTPNVFISLFRGDAKLIGLANIIVVPYEIMINPIFGRLSDSGVFNKFCFRDVEYWGRRAPVMFFALPICMVSTLLCWIGPESLKNPIAVAIWYCILRFSLTTGHSMFAVSFEAAFTELFPSKTERVRLGLAKFAFGMIAAGVGAIGIGTGALAVKEPGTSSQRQLFAFFGVLTASSWLLAIPYALLQRRSIMKKVAESSVWTGMTDVWRSSLAFRCFAVSAHFNSAAFALTLSALPFYFEVVLRFTSDQVSLAMRIVMIGAGTMMPLSLPLVACLNSRLDPSKVSGIAGLFCVIVGVCHAHASNGIAGNFWIQVIQIAVICGAGVGFVAVSWTGTQSAILTWIIDDDQVRRAEKAGVLNGKAASLHEIPARRDGMINAFKTCFSVSGVAWTGLFQLLLGSFGYDGERHSQGEPQPEEVRVMLDLLFIAVIPAMFIAFALPMLFFPLRGDRLQRLVTDYAKLYDQVANQAEVSRC